MYKQTILARKNLIAYLKLKKIPHRKAGMVVKVTCPFCQKHMCANIIPNNYYIKCLNTISCGKSYNLLDLAKHLEKEFPSDEKEQLQYLKELLKIDVITEMDKDNLEKDLDFYVQQSFDLVPIAKNSKIPIEKDWTNKEHKDKNEWLEWLSNDLNIGVKTGQRSNITVIDIDQKPMPDEIKNRLRDDNTFIQETTNGFHIFYKYEPDLPKTRIDEIKVDIENDGGQVVIYPSTIEGVQRKVSQRGNIAEMPVELKKYLQEKMTVPRKTNSEQIKEDIQTEEFNIGVLGEGQRNSSLVRIGGILRKELNLQQTGYVLNMLNRVLCKRPLPINEIRAMTKSLERYDLFDEKELAHRIFEYLKKVEEANRTEISMAVMGTNRGEDKKRVDEALTYLVKEGYVLKRGARYNILRKVDWKETLIEIGTPIDFQMPYFYDIANFNEGDLILIGSKNKVGKTHISMNIVKQLVKQGIKPYYISLETGSRFTKIAMQLGLKEGDFKWTFCADPTQIELEPNSVTIIDWLLIVNKAETDLIFKHFVEQLYKTNGIIIVFMQLKEDNGWFAPNLINQFPALAAKYIYDEEGDGEFGQFKVEVIREPKFKIKSYEIPCRYNWTTKELKRIEEKMTGDPKEKNEDKEDLF